VSGRAAVPAKVKLSGLNEAQDGRPETVYSSGREEVKVSGKSEKLKADETWASGGRWSAISYWSVGWEKTSVGRKAKRIESVEESMLDGVECARVVREEGRGGG
jgi:hypothetical protein